MQLSTILGGGAPCDRCERYWSRRQICRPTARRAKATWVKSPHSPYS